MINKIIDWIFLRYGINVPKLDVILALIILAGLIILLISIALGSHSFGIHPTGKVSMPLSNNLPSPGVGGKI